MDKEDIEDYINKLSQIERELNDDSDGDVVYLNQLESILNNLRNDVTIENQKSISQIILQVKCKKLHPNAVVPTYSKDGDAGLDLTATEIISESTKSITYGTGLSFEIPIGYVGLVFPRSSIRKYELQLSNSVGVIDSGYRGEVQATFNKVYEPNFIRVDDYKVGDRIAQMIILPYPKVQLIESDKLSDSERGIGGFGSTGT